MTGRTATFQQRIVKVVVPTLEAKAEWGAAAAAEGFNGNVSGWIRHVVTLHRAGHAEDLEAEARRAHELAQRVKDLEAENAMLRDAYDKVRQDFTATTKHYQELSGAEAAAAAERDARATLLALGLTGVLSGKRLPQAKSPSKSRPALDSGVDFGTIDYDRLVDAMRDMGHLPPAPAGARKRSRGGK